MRQPSRSWVGALALLLLWPVVAAGHGARLPLADWGPFAPALLSCHRELHRAAVRCARLSWLAQQRCLERRLAGQACSQSATNADLAAARRQALDSLDRHCSERQLQDLSFLGSFDAQADLIDACRTLPSAAASIAYGLYPPESLSPPQRTCVAYVGPRLGDLVQAVGPIWHATLDRIAARGGSAGERQDHLARAQARVQHKAEFVLAGARTACGDALLQQIYGRDFTSLVADLTGLAACPNARTCVQDGLLCPDPVCGNAIRESGEDCDDGNVTDGDGCPSTCILAF